MYSLEVKALVSPPTASIADEISSDDLRLVPLNKRCSRKCEAPAVESDSSREPTLTQIPKAAERTDLSSSVTIRKPLGKTVLAKLLALSFLRKICWN